MATALITEISPIMFTSQLDVVQMTVSSSPVTVVIEGDASGTLLSTQLYPLPSGSLVLYDVGKLVADRLGDLVADSVALSVNGSQVFSIVAVKSAVVLSMPAGDWVKSRFLTSMTGERDTYPSRLETLSCYNPAASACTVEALFLSAEDRISKKSFTPAPEINGSIYTYNVSPRLFTGTGDLVAYSVKVGNAVQRYRVLQVPMPLSQAFLFRNNFGCWETLYCLGELTTEPQYSRSSAVVNGRFTLYDIAETDNVTASTGVMRFGADRLVRDFARSRSAFLLNDDGTHGEEIVVTDCSVKSNNADDFNPQFSFTYRLAHKGASDLDGFKVFDLSFDDTYE